MGVTQIIESAAADPAQVAVADGIDARRDRRGGGAARRTLVLGVVLAVGVGGGALLARPRGDNPERAVAAAPAAEALPVAGDGGAAAPIDVSAREQPPPAPAGATGPAEAVEEFLAAEADADWAASWDLLSQSDRDRLGSVSVWEGQRPYLVPIVGATVGEVVSEGARATVSADLRLRSSLDLINGLVPARATSSWVAVREDGGWYVDHANSTYTPVYPDEAGIVPATQAWIADAIACRTPDRRPLGTAALVQSLCGAAGGDVPSGAVAVGDVGPLPEFDEVGPFVEAWGPETHGWARVATVDEPIQIRAVLAPLGDEWVVVGVLPPR